MNKLKIALTAMGAILLLAGIAVAQTVPFGVPAPDGLTACEDSLNTCNTNLGTCTNNLSSETGLYEPAVQA